MIHIYIRVYIYKRTFKGTFKGTFKMVSAKFLFPAHLCIGTRIEKFKKIQLIVKYDLNVPCTLHIYNIDVTYLQYCIYLMAKHSIVCICVPIFTAKIKSSLYINKIVMYMFHLTNRSFVLCKC